MAEQSIVVKVLSDGNPKSFREIVESSRLGYKCAESALLRLGKSEVVMRTEETVKERNKSSKAERA